MIRWSEPIFWTTEQEKFQIYYCFSYDERCFIAKARIFCHEVANDGNESQKGEMAIYLHRDRWACLHGLTPMEADKQLQQVVRDGDSDVAQYLLDLAKENLEDFLKECEKSPEFVITPIVL